MEIAWDGPTIRIRFPYVLAKIYDVMERRPIKSLKINSEPYRITKRKKAKSVEYRTFQVIPHSGVKNGKVDQLPNILADSYQEFFQRFKNGTSQEKLFFETKITDKTYRNYITTNAEMCDIIQQQAKMVWKDVTLQPVKPLRHDNDNALCYNIKLKHPFFMSLKTDKTMQQIPLPEILEVSRFLQKGDSVYTQFGIQAADEKWYKDAERERLDYKNPREYHKSTDLKTGHFGFDFVLRLQVTSENERRRKQIARGILLALAQLNQDNELIAKQPRRIDRFVAAMQSYSIPTPFILGRRQIITPPEIAHFIKLPQKQLQDDFPITETVTGRETSIPDLLQKGGIKLGEVTFKGEKQAIYMPTNNHDELCLPRIVIGGMGSGKTRGMGANWIVESVRNGFGALAIDPAKGEIGKEVTSVLPPEQCQIVKLGTVPIALDWCEVKHSSRAKNRLANTIIEFFNTNSDETGAQTARYLRASIMAMQTGKLAEIMRIFEDDDYRDGIVNDMRDSIHKSTLIDYGKMSDGKKAQILAPILNRLDTILGDEYLAECMESDQSIDMAELMSQRKAFIIDVPKSELGPEAVDLIVNLLSTKIDLAMTLREESKQHPFFVVVDELHQMLKSTKVWKSAMVESRKWRVGYVLLFHSFEQIPKDLSEIIKSAGPHYHLYSSSKKTFTDLKEEIAPFTVEDGLKLKKYHAINVIRAGSDGLIKPIVAHMLPPPSKGGN